MRSRLPEFARLVTLPTYAPLSSGALFFPGRGHRDQARLEIAPIMKHSPRSLRSIGVVTLCCAAVVLPACASEVPSDDATSAGKPPLGASGSGSIAGNSPAGGNGSSAGFTGTSGAPPTGGISATGGAGSHQGGHSGGVGGGGHAGTFGGFAGAPGGNGGTSAAAAATAVGRVVAAPAAPAVAA